MLTGSAAVRATLAVLVCIAVLSSAAASGQSAPVESIGANQPDDSRDYQKGAMELRLVGGGALPVDLSSARPDRRMWIGAFDIGWILTARHGPSILAGQFELAGQVMPVVVRGPEEFWGVALNPVLRWNFSGAHRVRPYAEASAGLMLVDWEQTGPGRVTRNFNEQVGFGVRFGSAAGRGPAIGYRFQHISNGDGSIPSPGIDTHLIYVGISSFR